MDAWREKAVCLAQGFLGTPYVPRGMCPGLALDCGTLLWHVYKEIIPLPAFPADYPADWAMHNEDTRYVDWIEPYVIDVKRPIRGGICVWKYGRSFSHSGIVLDKKHVIHAWGRQAFGCVQRSHVNFFKIGVEPREVLYFDLRPECLLDK